MIPSLLLLLTLAGARADHIDILPLGAAESELIKTIAGGLSVGFSVPLDILRPEPLPGSAFDSARGQYRSSDILDYLISRFQSKLSPPAEPNGRILAITNADIYADGLSFVFGEADIDHRLAVVSLARLKEEYYGRQPSRALLVSRALREATHELGHTYGLPHCPDLSCVMHFSRDLAEADRRTTNFCPDCFRKLPHNLER